MYDKLALTSTYQPLKEPLVRLLDRRTYWVPQILFSPDGNRLASLSESRVKLWNVANGQNWQTLVGHTTEEVSHIAFSSDGKMLASCSPRDRTITVWDVARGRELRILKSVGETTRVAFSRDSQMLASGSSRGPATCVTLWNPANGTILRMLEHERRNIEQARCTVKSLAFSLDGRMVALGSTTGVTWWELESGQMLNDFLAEPDSFRAGKRIGIDALAFSSDHKTILIWDQAAERIVQRKVANGSLVKMLRAPAGSYIIDVKHLPDGGQLAVLLGRKVLDEENCFPTRTLVYDDQTLQQIRSIDIEADLYGDLAFSPDGTLIATAERDGTISIWNVAAYINSFDIQQA